MSERPIEIDSTLRTRMELEMSGLEQPQQLERSESVREHAHVPLLSSKDRAEVDADHGGNKPMLQQEQHRNSEIGSTDGEITAELMREMEVKCAAYVRDDVYGTWGRGPLPIHEKVRLGLALVTIVPIRLLVLLSILAVYHIVYYSLLLCAKLRLPGGGGEEGQEDYSTFAGVRRRVIVFTGRWAARSGLFALGFYWIKVTQRSPDTMKNLHLGLGMGENENDEGLLKATKGHPGVIVSNHVSYIDILYHIWASFPSFVAKMSILKLPVVAQMSKTLGCVYVERESRGANFNGVSGVVTERLQAAQVNPDAPFFLLFPEGTTTNGKYLLPFKTGAFLAGTPVLPVILKYPHGRFNPAWDTMGGLRHLILLLSQLVNYLEVTRLPVYYPSAKECSDPKIYANNARTIMAAEGELTLSNIGLYEKYKYHAALSGKIVPSKSGKKLQ